MTPGRFSFHGVSSIARRLLVAKKPASYSVDITWLTEFCCSATITGGLITGRNSFLSLPVRTCGVGGYLAGEINDREGRLMEGWCAARHPPTFTARTRQLERAADSDCRSAQPPAGDRCGKRVSDSIRQITFAVVAVMGKKYHQHESNSAFAITFWRKEGCCAMAFTSTRFALGDRGFLSGERSSFGKAPIRNYASPQGDAHVTAAYQVW